MTGRGTLTIMFWRSSFGAGGLSRTALRRVQALCLAVVAGLWLPAAATADEHELDEEDAYHFGILEYEIACLPCHGLDGRGDGPLAARLGVPPADLTTIMRRNDGAFPAAELAEIIDGRARVAAHGRRDMPVWGDRYRLVLPDGPDRETIEAEARTRIAALIEYLRSIQTGPQPHD